MSLGIGETLYWGIASSTTQVIKDFAPVFALCIGVFVALFVIETLFMMAGFHSRQERGDV